MSVASSERHPLRLPRWAGLSLIAIDLGTMPIWAVAELTGAAPQWPVAVHLAWTAGNLAALILAWRIYPGLIGLIVAQFAGASVRNLAEALVDALLATIVAAAYLPARRLRPFLVVQAVWVAVATTVKPGNRPLLASTCIGFVAAGAAIGFAIRHFRARLAQEVAERAALEDRHARSQSEQRKALAQELHDGLSSELTAVASQDLVADSEDPEELRKAVRVSADAARRARAELVELVQMLKDAEETTDFTALTSVSAPTSVGDELGRTLATHGFEPEIDIDPGVDALTTVQRHTISRILQEAGHNMLRHAEPGPCRLEARVTPAHTYVRATSRLPDLLPERGAGMGLIGLEERVKLVGGRFSAGPQDGQWVVEGTLGGSALTWS